MKVGNTRHGTALYKNENEKCDRGGAGVLIGLSPQVSGTNATKMFLKASRHKYRRYAEAGEEEEEPKWQELKREWKKRKTHQG